ncbi:hypothetical protein [Bradyrhizobium erythrophlei]|uniref:SMODS and SLOG-associating 2TM effector domain-containing protein n=1 Tax=Bradyrhizobium erythrophlei TaxID=1437360 RepID=A0A1M7UVJ7_9BRAD|nr:hypothetical protein [Bradyrhizobium erythrophlei]SHN86926.1 hypothetical protein SAMN05444170_6921 [Bradyrhizobium erythrophlei]
MSATIESAATAKSVLTEEEAKAAIAPYVEGMLEWYWHETDKWEHMAWRLQTAILIMSSLVTVVAALPSTAPEYQPWMKWLVVIISASTTLLSGLLSKSGIERTAQLREQGRIKLVALQQKTVLRFTKKMMTEEERAAYLEKVIDAAELVEQQFGVHPLTAGKRHSK